MTTIGRVGEDLSEEVGLITEKGILVKQEVFYEWWPTKCSHCKIFWYLKKDYKNKGNKRKVWVPVNKQSEAPPPED